MTTHHLEAEVRVRPEVPIIDLHGDIDAFAQEALDVAYTEASGHSSKAVLLNFARVDYINSTGIALIVGVLAKARKEGRRVLTCGLSEHYEEIFQITRLADFMSIFPDEEGAIADVARSMGS